MRAVLLAGVLLLSSTAAQAYPVAFQLVDMTYNSFAQSLGAGFAFALTISDAAVTRGSFNLTGSGGGGPTTYVGDVADFVSAVDNADRATATSLVGTLRIMLNFSSTGAVLSGNINFNPDFSGLSLRGTDGIFSGTFGTEFDHCPAALPGPQCGLSARLATTNFVATAVPEPASFLALALGTLGAIRARSSAAHARPAARRSRTGSWGRCPAHAGDPARL